MLPFDYENDNTTFYLLFREISYVFLINFLLFLVIIKHRI